MDEGLQVTTCVGGEPAVTLNRNGTETFCPPSKSWTLASVAAFVPKLWTETWIGTLLFTTGSARSWRSADVMRGAGHVTRGRGAGVRLENGRGATVVSESTTWTSASL